MGIKTFRPNTPGLRHRVQVVNSEITANRSEPEKSLTKGKKSNGGRASNGRISVRHQGGGHKQKYRVIDFKRDKAGVPGTVASIEYDPNRSANIALVQYADGERRYILSPKGLAVGQKVLASPQASIEPGNALPLEAIPVGITVHNVELPSARAASWPAPPARARSSRPRRATTSSSSSPPASSARSSRSAPPPSVPSATRST